MCDSITKLIFRKKKIVRELLKNRIKTNTTAKGNTMTYNKLCFDNRIEDKCSKLSHISYSKELIHINKAFPGEQVKVWYVLN